MVSNNIKKVLKITAVLTGICTAVILLVGTSLLSISSDVKYLQNFVSNADDIQSNFERSLQLYTDNTKDTIDFLLSLRPESEEDFIDFISNIEAIGEKLNLELNIDSLSSRDEEGILRYEVEFYASQDDFTRFIRELEASSYFLRITEYSYTSLSRLIETNNQNEENFSITFNLYTK